MVRPMPRVPVGPAPHRRKPPSFREAVAHGSHPPYDRVMAQEVLTILVDDIDGTEAAETVTFALDGESYEIDLSEKNAKELRQNLGHWTERARTSGRPARIRKSLAAVGASRNAEIRAWAYSHGHDVPARGRIPQRIVAAFDAAQ